MKTTKNYQGQEVRNSSDSKFVIFYEGIALKTEKSGAMHSYNGIVLTATLPTGEMIKWRSNDNLGRKGFGLTKSYNTATEDSKLNRISNELLSKLEYKNVKL